MDKTIANKLIYIPIDNTRLDTQHKKPVPKVVKTANKKKVNIKLWKLL